MKKIKLLFMLLVMFLIVFATNKMDNNYFSILEKSFTSIYEDRLVVKNYLFKISRLMEKKKDYVTCDNPRQHVSLNTVKNDSIDILLEKFAATELTAPESRQLQYMQNNLAKLYTLENQYFDESVTGDRQKILGNIIQQYEKIWKNMFVLSEIQLTEGKRLMSSSDQVFKSTNLLSRIEMVFLILIGICFGAIIAYKPTEKSGSMND